MKRLQAASLALVLATTPISATSQDIDPDQPLSEQLGEILRGLRETIEPALQEMIDHFSVLEEIDSFENYTKPEVLPNGDILIRRRPDAPEYAPPATRDPETPQEDGVDT